MGRRLPAVVEAVRDGRLHLSAVLLLAPRLTGENHRALMAEASGKSKREVEEVVARWFPRPDAATSVRRLPTAVRGESGRYKVSFAASQMLVDKLEEARALMSHVNPGGDVATVVERALSVLCEQLKKRRFGAGAVKPGGDGPEGGSLAPGAARGSGRRSRHVPAAVRAAVYRRDEGCCTFVGAGGRRCGARRLLELHHERPYARGGAHTEGCLTLRCRLHDDLAAREDFGEGHVRRRIDRRRRVNGASRERLASGGSPRAVSPDQEGVVTVTGPREPSLGSGAAGAAPPGVRLDGQTTGEGGGSDAETGMGRSRAVAAAAVLRFATVVATNGGVGPAIRVDGAGVACVAVLALAASRADRGARVAVLGGAAGVALVARLTALEATDRRVVSAVGGVVARVARVARLTAGRPADGHVRVAVGGAFARVALAAVLAPRGSAERRALRAVEVRAAGVARVTVLAALGGRADGRGLGAVRGALAAVPLDARLASPGPAQGRLGWAVGVLDAGDLVRRIASARDADRGRRATVGRRGARIAQVTRLARLLGSADRGRGAAVSRRDADVALAPVLADPRRPADGRRLAALGGVGAGTMLTQLHVATKPPPAHTPALPRSLTQHR